MSLLIGADPEVFVTVKDVPVSAFDMVPGTKEKPFPVPYGAVQVDGMALEFNIEPADKEEVFVRNIKEVMSSLEDMLPEDNKLSIVPSVHFRKSVMDKQPAKALQLGCDPDFNAYTMKMNKQPKAPKDMRSAGGHVHIGWCTGEEPLETAHFTSCCELVKELDYFLGLPSLVLDDNTERRKIYGQAGAFRPKSYGVEYRVLSNFWITNEEYMKFVFAQVNRTFEYLVEKKGRGLYSSYGNYAANAISSNVVNSFWELKEHFEKNNYKTPLIPEEFNHLFKREKIKVDPKQYYYTTYSGTATTTATW